ncbi:MAG: helix-turn-helix domain-containing protein, partial [Actinobacteria bacterium]|nr:helix-turn-helix domain-containing protein [Actinomycetota bacterium]
VAVATGLSRATARRSLLTLVDEGYVSQNGRVFTLTPKVLDLAHSFLSSFRVADIAQPAMERLVEEIQESSSMSVLDGDMVVYVARVPTKRIMTISLALGSRLPAYPTSMGRVLLAALPPEELDEYVDATEFVALTKHTITDVGSWRREIDKVRSAGYALVDQELEEGVRSIAAPVTTGQGRVLAAINVSCHASRVTVARMRQEFLPRLLRAARETSELLAALGIR